MLRGICLDTKHRFRGELILVSDWRNESQVEHLGELSNRTVFGNATAQIEGFGQNLLPPLMRHHHLDQLYTPYRTDYQLFEQQSVDS